MGFEKLKEGPLTSDALAEATKTDKRYIKEWCLNMAATGFLSYGEGSYGLTDDFRAALTGPGDCMARTSCVPAIMDADRLTQVYKTGKGIGWSQHKAGLQSGAYRLTKPLYEGNLVNILPEEIKEKLENGGALADVGCGE